MVTTNDVKTWIELYVKKGWSTTKISDKYLVSRQTVSNHLKKAKVKMRKAACPAYFQCPKCKHRMHKKNLIKNTEAFATKNGSDQV